MQDDLAIEARSLSRTFRRRWRGEEFRALDDVSLEVPRGTTFGFLGPNGAGKTTFVKVMLASVHPTAGELRIFGRPSREREARRPVGYLPENHRFPTYLTGRTMLDFYGALSGVDARQRARRVPELLDLVGLERWGEVRLRKYSKGMLQRLGLAQALMHRPRLLVLDEPTDGVDPLGRRHIRDILTAVEREGTTVFINSHLLSEVESYCREVAILHRGRIVKRGLLKELIAGSGYDVVAAADVPRTLQNLPFAAAGVQNGRATFRFGSRMEMNAGVDALRAAGLEIESVAPRAGSLEDVFVDAVGARPE